MKTDFVATYCFVVLCQIYIGCCDAISAVQPPEKLFYVSLHTANELRAWLLYYSLPCLESILPKTYWNHFALLVEAIHILLGEEICKGDLKTAKGCLELFYKYFCNFYGMYHSNHYIFNPQQF